MGSTFFNVLALVLFLTNENDKPNALPLLVLRVSISAGSPTRMLNLLVSLPYLSTRNTNKSEEALALVGVVQRL
jgi:hypothetical protein